jgi:thymidylate kinase
MDKLDFVILIGSDGAGKSTIAEGLSKILGYPVEHHGPVKSYEDGIKEYFNCITNTDYSVIKDRFHEGEAIYAPLYRGYIADYFPALEERLKEKFNVLLVKLEPPFETILKRIEERGEDFVKPEHFKYCYDKINEIYEESTLPKITIDTSKGSVEENVKEIVLTLIENNIKHGFTD